MNWSAFTPRSRCYQHAYPVAARSPQPDPASMEGVALRPPPGSSDTFLCNLFLGTSLRPHGQLPDAGVFAFVVLQGSTATATFCFAVPSCAALASHTLRLVLPLHRGSPLLQHVLAFCESQAPPPQPGVCAYLVFLLRWSTQGRVHAPPSLRVAVASCLLIWRAGRPITKVRRLVIDSHLPGAGGSSSTRGVEGGSSWPRRPSRSSYGDSPRVIFPLFDMSQWCRNHSLYAFPAVHT